MQLAVGRFHSAYCLLHAVGRFAVCNSPTRFLPTAYCMQLAEYCRESAYCLLPTKLPTAYCLLKVHAVGRKSAYCLLPTKVPTAYCLPKVHAVGSRQFR